MLIRAGNTRSSPEEGEQVLDSPSKVRLPFLDDGDSAKCNDIQVNTQELSPFSPPHQHTHNNLPSHLHHPVCQDTKPHLLAILLNKHTLLRRMGTLQDTLHHPQVFRLPMEEDTLDNRSRVERRLRHLLFGWALGNSRQHDVFYLSICHM